MRWTTVRFDAFEIQIDGRKTVSDVTDDKDTRRRFYWGYGGCVGHMLKNAIIRPSYDRYIQPRRMGGTGMYTLMDGGHEFEVRDAVSGYAILCADSAVRPVYRALQHSLKELDAMHEKREIIVPILPQATIDQVESLVFDFYQAIDDLKTTRGFGNVGLIFSGPPGVGKTESMRWIGEACREEFNRDSFSLSLSELNKLLASGVPLNTDKALIFIDDIDANLLRDREETKNPLTSQFLTCLDGLDKREGRVIIVSTNERLDKVDTALTRPGRFEKVIEFDYPTEDLVDLFCIKRDIELSPSLFYGWSFARIDLFLARFKVANHRYGTPLNVFYERFVAEMGEEDATVAAVRAKQESSFE